MSVNLAKKEVRGRGRSRSWLKSTCCTWQAVVSLASLAGGGFCNVAHFVCNFLVNIIGNNGKIAQLQADNAEEGVEREERRSCLSSVCVCVSELNMPWSAVCSVAAG